MKLPRNAGVRRKRNKGRWAKEEHESFLRGLRHCDKNWEAIREGFVTSRSATQIRTHAQKYFRKTELGLPFPDEPYESMEEQQAALAASTPALVTTAPAASPCPITSDDVVGYEATESETNSITASAEGAYPPPSTSTPSDLLDTPAEMGELMTHLLHGTPLFSFPWGLSSLQSSEDKKLARLLGPALETWDSQDYDAMDGGKLTLSPSAKETENGGRGNALPAELTTKDNKRISAAYESGAAALAEGTTLGACTYPNQVQAFLLCNFV